jgi:hypothetical protein
MRGSSGLNTYSIQHPNGSSLVIREYAGDHVSVTYVSGSGQAGHLTHATPVTLAAMIRSLG